MGLHPLMCIGNRGKSMPRMHAQATRLLAVGFCLLFAATAISGVHAQSSPSLPPPEEDFQRHMKVNEDITPLGDSPFGEQVDLSTGGLSFEQSDIVLKGTGPDIVIARSIAQTSGSSGANP